MSNADPKTTESIREQNRRTFRVCVEPVQLRHPEVAGDPWTMTTLHFEIKLTEEESRIVFDHFRDYLEKFTKTTVALPSPNADDWETADVDDVGDDSFDQDLNRIIDEDRELLDRLAR